MNTNQQTEQPIPSKELDRIAGDALYNCPKDAPAGSEAGRWKHGYIQGGKAEYARAHSLPPSAVGEAAFRDIISRADRYLREINDGEVDDPSVGLYRDRVLIELINEIDALPPPTPSRAGEIIHDLILKVLQWANKYKIEKVQGLWISGNGSFTFALSDEKIAEEFLKTLTLTKQL